MIFLSKLMLKWVNWFIHYLHCYTWAALKIPWEGQLASEERTLFLPFLPSDGPPCIMCVQYIGGCSVHWGCSVHRRDTISKSGGYHDECGGYHEYIGGCSVHRRDTISTSDGYHEYIGGISWYMWGSNLINPFDFCWKLQSTEHPPMYSWYPPDVLMISPQCTHGIPHMYHDIPTCIMISPDILSIPRCTHDIPRCIYGIPPMYWTPPDVLMISPRCTHDIPRMYSWYPPDVLMVSHPCTHGIPPMYWTLPRCTEHTLYRVWTHFMDLQNKKKITKYNKR